MKNLEGKHAVVFGAGGSVGAPSPRSSRRKVLKSFCVDLGMPPERVFRALTTNEVEKWSGSARTYRVTDWKAEPRVGARWSLMVRLPDGTRPPAGGDFLEIDRRIRSSRLESTNGTIGPGG